MINDYECSQFILREIRPILRFDATFGRSRNDPRRGFRSRNIALLIAIRRYRRFSSGGPRNAPRSTAGLTPSREDTI
jgi:hypothetical protein